jgi:hypothetical protein
MSHKTKRAVGVVDSADEIVAVITLTSGNIEIVSLHGREELSPGAAEVRVHDIEQQGGVWHIAGATLGVKESNELTPILRRAIADCAEEN